MNETTLEVKTSATYLALTALIFALSIAILLLSTLVALTVSEHWQMKRDCEEGLARNEHCIAGYFPMEVKEYYSETGIEVPKEKKL
jgi:hypothetical protein